MLGELAAQFHRAPGGCQRRIQLSCRGVALNEVRAVADDAQQVVDVVRHATRQTAHGGHALPLCCALLGQARAFHGIGHLAFEFGPIAADRFGCFSQCHGDVVAFAQAGGTHGHRHAFLQLQGCSLQTADRADDAPCQPQPTRKCQREQGECADRHFFHRCRQLAIELFARHADDVCPAHRSAAEIGCGRLAVQRHRHEFPRVLLLQERTQVGRGLTADKARTAWMASHDGAFRVQHHTEPARRVCLRVDDALHFRGPQHQRHVVLHRSVALHRHGRKDFSLLVKAVK